MGTVIELEAESNIFFKKLTLNLRGKLVDLRQPHVMGILNVTPDSFYDGGKYHRSEQKLLSQAEQMLQEGATILDVGGYSSRPGATDITLEEEKSRVITAIELIANQLPEANISVDTFRAEVAEEALLAGACMVNDISGGELDPKMFEVVARYRVPYVLMHMRGTPQTMKQLTDYDNVVVELLDYFQRKIAQLRQRNVADIILDLGFGFAKNIDQNYFLLKNLRAFQELGLPLLAGLSRKSMIYKRLGGSPNEALNGTTVLNTIALMKGASILRVHDVKEAKEAIQLVEYMKNE
ncbi:dihydropteroate synthase [Tunicatimonas pelagia]|uniref:dihydropteroate synthase n=1 Tax=Tunicatimonas pelagia TaxID=931531 RepID=UPI002666DB19|nr:dihydropteroate synthase [Tunicatimonas pelagia]WKN41732.1 dihydropteroate synthase [Tunicatimonas pelagia]